jgi:hypothetical protein
MKKSKALRRTEHSAEQSRRTKPMKLIAVQQSALRKAQVCQKGA